MELPNDITICHKVIRAQGAQIEKLSARIQELEIRLNKNSSNSDKPPSSDGLAKKPSPKPAFPKKKGKKQGGQPGHKGKSLEMSANPDFVHKLLPNQCSCGHKLDQDKAKILESGQVLDLPVPKLEVHEYQKLGCTCTKCGKANEGVFPQGVTPTVQYGNGVRALVSLLNIHFKLPFIKVQTLFNDLYGYLINPATIIKSNNRCFNNLEASQEKIKSHLPKSALNHFDETGARISGALHWVHVCSNRLYTYLFANEKRGTQAMESDDSLLPDFNNWAVHDCLAAYFKFTNCSHALCGAHLIRELVGLEEAGVAWASWFKRFLFALYYMTNEGKGKLTPSERQKALMLYDTIWKNADQIEPMPVKKPGVRGRPKATKGRNLLNRFQIHKEGVIAFAFYEFIPFTNNQGERDFRETKAKIKMSGCFRTMEGAKVYARVQSFISTARKHDQSVFQELIKVMANQPNFLTQSPS